MSLDVAACRSEREKLEWAFRLYDVDASGSINLKEMAAIMVTMDNVEGRPINDDEDDDDGKKSVEEQAAELFAKLDVDDDGEITMKEFVNGYLRLLGVEVDDDDEGRDENAEGQGNE